MPADVVAAVNVAFNVMHGIYMAIYSWTPNLPTCLFSQGEI